MALGYCLMIMLFTILFGARHIATREKHEGLVFAIAFESIVKLVTFGAIGLYALATWWPAPTGDLAAGTSRRCRRCTRRCRKARGVPCCWCSSPRPSSCHMYHMTFTENLNPRGLVSASWDCRCTCY